MLPTIPPVPIDIMANLHTLSNNSNSSSLKVGQVYDNGDVHLNILRK
ncbi:hypothetical protein NARC_40017 [Candidatus Nitrosocosmicus arcticus]|uniref:Uncharacterized protein n=1 Tax=Candidatus Nitrosocosmicus arcticus TaxID=2035267 RepID=A0A557SWS2_9ARCH|nr:hypothetical protein NARC_40017 [Candidatus Nitrosocosmicus arcticus]